MKPVIIGTRGSLLARSQANFLKYLLEQNIPNRNFQIKTIKTQGDIIQDRPLHELEGKDFFTKELDSALLEESIDLVIHSGKDLGLIRPKGITTAAVLPRALPHDIFLCSKKTKLKLLNNEFKKFSVGSSSPRRITQSEHLPLFVPGLKGVEIENKNLRGNIDTRIKKLLSGEYDSIILAAAGLERVTYLEEGQDFFKEYADQLEFVLLPVQYHTPAASQGALIVECLEKSQDIYSMLSELNDEKTKQNIYEEKKIFQEYGGSCYLPMGIYKLDSSLFLSGKTLDNKSIRKSISSNTLDLKSKNIFIGMSSQVQNHCFDELITKSPVIQNSGTSQNSFLATNHALENFSNYKHEGLIFAAGTHSMRALVKKNYWCHGAASIEGEKSLKKFMDSRTFNYLANFKNQWQVFTHKDSVSEIGEIIPSYERKTTEISKEFEENLRNCQYFYWTSFKQYQIYLDRFDFLRTNDIVHFTGKGKTHDEFKKNKIKHIELSSHKELLGLDHE